MRKIFDIIHRSGSAGHFVAGFVLGLVSVLLSILFSILEAEECEDNDIEVDINGCLFVVFGGMIGNFVQLAFILFLTTIQDGF